LLDQLRARYSIDVALPQRPFRVRWEHNQTTTSLDCQPGSSEQVAWYAPIFAEEFGLYPLLLVRNTKLRLVVLCAEMLESRRPRPGAERPSPARRKPLLYVNKPEGGVPDAAGGVLYFDVTWERDDEEYVRKHIHHEFYHLVQRCQFGRSGDRGWAALNPPDFGYGPGGKAVKFDPSFWIVPAEEWGNGFLNRYSMSSPDEDQAEIFSHLLTEPARLEQQLQTDDILRAKVERLKWSLGKFCPAVNAEFWQRVAESRWPYGL
jgi:hypothetical protein